MPRGRRRSNPFAVGPSAMFEQAIARHREGRLVAARDLYENILAGNPRHFDSLHMLGVIALQSGEPERALQLIGTAIGIRPDVPAAHVNLAAVLRALGRLEDALSSYDRAIGLEPRRVASLQDRGDVLLALGRPTAAVASFDAVLAVAPDDVAARLGRSIALKRFDGATVSTTSDVAVETLRRDYAAAFHNHGNSMLALRRLEQAMASYDRALALAPRFAEAHNNRATILADLRRTEEAIAGYDRAIALRPDWAEPYNNRANALAQLGKGQDALAGYDHAISLRPDYAEAHNNRGNLLLELNRPAEAAAAFQHALAIRPDYPFLPGALLNAKLKSADWAGIEAHIEGIREAILAGRPAAAPFITALAIDDPAVQARSACILAEALYPTAPPIPAQPGSPGKRKIRLGYYSSDFHDHATSSLIAGLFEHHDITRFEVCAFSFGPDRDDGMRRRLRAAPIRFLDVRNSDDGAVAALSRSLGIDIAVDLKGYTEGARPGIFAARSAPLQVSWLGYPGTMGSAHHDYVIADRTVIPPEHWAHYSEQVAYVPGTYQVNDAQRPIADRMFTRAELGLPEQAFVFCCFNAVAKIQPSMFDRWMRILGAVEGSLLWLHDDNPDATANLRREAGRRGIDPARLVFAPHMPRAEHLARYRQADLFIDSAPYNAHTTASDALWTGLPLLSWVGSAFPSRVAASLLHACGLPELVASDVRTYERRAIELAHDPDQLQALRRRLATQRQKSRLFDTARFAREIEALFQAMQARQRAGMWPAPLVLPESRQISGGA